ncbi:MAG: hypothetical protein ACLT98_14065 [Eggerthellaceae bacterium]
MKLVNLTEIVRGCGFGVFAKAVGRRCGRGHQRRARVTGAAAISTTG